MVKVKIIGAGGYGGVGAVEILSRHPEAELVALIDISDTGKPFSSLYPHLAGICDMPITHPDDDTTTADVVFFATPDRVGMSHANAYIEQGCKVVDYSGDFRFNTKEAYAEYASRLGKETVHDAEVLLSDSAYGLCEIHRDEVKRACVVGNPGCFAVSAILGAAPAVQENLIDRNTLVFDAKTGVSGAGKKANDVFHFPHRSEEMNAYKIGKHQHVMEVERELGLLAKEDVRITFTTQVIPLVRGIMTTIYARLNDDVDYDRLLDAYRTFYNDEPFVKVYAENEFVGNRNVRGTNNCALWVNIERRTNEMIIVSHIDNLMKGQAGSAVQNMNVLFGLEETHGLAFPGMYP